MSWLRYLPTIKKIVKDQFKQGPGPDATQIQNCPHPITLHNTKVLLLSGEKRPKWTKTFKPCLDVLIRCSNKSPTVILTQAHPEQSKSFWESPYVLLKLLGFLSNFFQLRNLSSWPDIRKMDPICSMIMSLLSLEEMLHLTGRYFLLSDQTTDG